MKAKDVEVGAIYFVRVSGMVCRVKLTNSNPFGGWDGVNLITKHRVRIKSAARLRMRWTPEE